VTIDDIRREASAEELARQAAEERAAARLEQVRRVRRGSLWLLAVLLLSLLVGLMIGRVVNGQIPWGGVPPPARLLEVRAGTDSAGPVLDLLLERPVRYRRSAQGGALSLYLQGVRSDGERSGRLGQGAASLAWRVRPADGALQVLLVGLGEALRVEEEAVADDEGWHLRLRVQAPPR